jgi:hypothetical protein
MSESKHIYIVYKTINLVNNFIYIGVHKQKFFFPILFDGYFGSGTFLNKAIKKYGKENFIRETLCVFHVKDEAFEKEKEIVDETFISRKDTYNLRIGGLGGSLAGENHPCYGRKHTEEWKERMRVPKSEEWKERMRVPKPEEWKERMRVPKPEGFGQKISIAQKGKPLPEETKQKISETLKSKPPVECPHCGKSCDERNARRWHLDNRKHQRVESPELPSK